MVVLTMKWLGHCRRPSLYPEKNSVAGSDEFGLQDELLWYKDHGQHVNGEFSMAVFQGNKQIEDHCQLESGSLGLSESGPFGSFVGVYDGHGGPEAARYVTNHFFGHIKKSASGQQSMSLDVLRRAIQATENGFLSLVSQAWTLKPQIASVGTCCLAGVVCDGTIYVACLGDSRAVLGKLQRETGEVIAVQLSDEHNVSIESVRREVQSVHQDDPQIVVLRHNVWRVKGLIQISRSIGDAYLKKTEYNCELLDPKYRLREAFKKPILSSEPSLYERIVKPEDQFIIFATDGLWEQISNQEAVNIVSKKPRNGIARRLVRAAIQRAAKKREIRYSDIMKVDLDVRRHFHDDITVVVLFIDSSLARKEGSSKRPSVSLRAGCITQPQTRTGGKM